MTDLPHSPETLLAQARQPYEQRAWKDGYSALTAVDRLSPLAKKTRGVQA